MRPPLAVLLAAAVLLAGCSALPVASDRAATETVTPVSVPETETGEHAGIQRPAGTPLPPGLAPDGSVNVTRLVCASNRYLSNRSYSAEQSFVYDNPELNRTIRNSGTVTAEGQRVRYDYGDNGSANVTYLDPTGYYEHRVANGSVTTDYTPYNATRVAILPPPDFPGSTATLPPSAVSVSTVERNGETLYRVHVPAWPRSVSSLRNFTATFYVTPQGLVRSMSIEEGTYLEQFPDENSSYTTYRRQFRVRSVGETTVTEPDWARRLKRNVTLGERQNPRGLVTCRE